MGIECVPCMVKQTLEIAQLVSADQKVHEEALRAIMRIISSSNWDVPAPILAVKILNKLAEITGESDPYKKIKKQSNDNALKMYPFLKKLVFESTDPLLTALKISAAGNVIDYGVRRKFNIKETIEKVLQFDFYISAYDEFQRRIKDAKTLLLIGDNAGEIVFDKLLVEALKDVKVTYMVRAHPFLNDATIKDAEHVKISSIAEVAEFNLGNADKGIKLDEIDNYIEQFDIVISKGQGNFELLSEIRGEIFFLFMVKCEVISRYVNTPIGAHVFILR